VPTLKVGDDIHGSATRETSNARAGAAAQCY